MPSRTPPPDNDPSRLAARERLKAQAHHALAELACVVLERPITVRAKNRMYTVEVKVTAAGEAGEEVKAPAVPPMFFSPMEAAIVNAVGPGGELIGKKIAAACCQEYNGYFRIFLRNLVNRGVLAKGKTGQTYRWSDSYRALATGRTAAG